MLYFIALVLVVGWFLGFFIFTVGKLIHLLLLLAVIAILLRIIRGDKLF